MRLKTCNPTGTSNFTRQHTDLGERRSGNGHLVPQRPLIKSLPHHGRTEAGGKMEK